MFRVIDDGHDLFCRPVQIDHVNHDGEVVRNERSESDGQRNRGEHNQQGNNSYERCVGQCGGTGRSMVIEERLPGDNHDFYKRRGTCCDVVEQPFPRKIFHPMRHKHRKYS